MSGPGNAFTTSHHFAPLRKQLTREAIRALYLEAEYLDSQLSPRFNDIFRLRPHLNAVFTNLKKSTTPYGRDMVIKCLNPWNRTNTKLDNLSPSAISDLVLWLRGHIFEARLKVAKWLKLDPLSYMDLWYMLYELNWLHKYTSETIDAENDDFLGWIYVEACAQYGIRHPLTLKVAGSMAWAFYNNGKLEKSKKWYRWLLEVRTQLLGALHEATSGALVGLSAVSRDIGDTTESLHLATTAFYSRLSQWGLESFFTNNALIQVQLSLREMRNHSLSTHWVKNMLHRIEPQKIDAESPLFEILLDAAASAWSEHDFDAALQIYDSLMDLMTNSSGFPAAAAGHVDNITDYLWKGQWPEEKELRIDFDVSKSVISLWTNVFRRLELLVRSSEFWQMLSHEDEISPHNGATRVDWYRTLFNFFLGAYILGVSDNEPSELLEDFALLLVNSTMYRHATQAYRASYIAYSSKLGAQSLHALRVAGYISQLYIDQCQFWEALAWSRRCYTTAVESSPTLLQTDSLLVLHTWFAEALYLTGETDRALYEFRAIVADHLGTSLESRYNLLFSLFRVAQIRFDDFNDMQAAFISIEALFQLAPKHHAPAELRKIIVVAANWMTSVCSDLGYQVKSDRWSIHARQARGQNITLIWLQEFKPSLLFPFLGQKAVVGPKVRLQYTPTATNHSVIPQTITILRRYSTPSTLGFLASLTDVSAVCYPSESSSYPPLITMPTKNAWSMS